MSAREIVEMVAGLFRLGLTSDEIACLVAAAIAMMQVYAPDGDI